MRKSVLTVTEVNQNFSKAKRAVAEGPVTITERGQPAMVLMRHSDFRMLQEQAAHSGAAAKGRVPLWQLAEELGVTDIELELPERTVEPFPRPNQGLDEFEE
jgi:prevent-host-death family protein